MCSANPMEGYGKQYRDRVNNLDIWLVTGRGKNRGILNGKSPKQVIDIYESIHRCLCGSDRIKLTEGEYMGDFEIHISCNECKRHICRTAYEADEEHDFITVAIMDWNAGRSDE